MSKTDTHRNRSILEMDCDQARSFLLEQDSYCKFDLPYYFQFKSLLDEVSKVLDNKKLLELISNKKPPNKKPMECEDVNHLILDNKDGKYAWRPLELIHPAIYVSLVNSITEKKNWAEILTKFSEFRENENIKCLSLPVKSLTEEKNKAEQITHWWREIEQKSIELALDYEIMIHTDITDCYGSFYTHSIAWALHTKKTAKENQRCKKLVGNTIDKHIQYMRQGQTNGISQGSVLMDFIAEMVLGYADGELTSEIEKQKIKDYCIIRYRDDYRIFTNNSQDGERILKALSEVLINLE